MAIITGDAGDNILNGGAEDDTIDGQAGNDELYGGGGQDLLLGGAGNDRLDGGTGADTMMGGDGNDTYLVDNALDSVIEVSGEGVDRVFSSVNYTLTGDVERLTLESGSAAVIGTGNALDNEIFGNQNNNILNGLDGNDKIDGGAGDDTIMGGAGEDILDGLDGNDSMDGGDGYDNLEGGNGADLLDGGAGDDWLDGEAGADVLIGGAGHDTYFYNVGYGIERIEDVVVAGAGNRILFAAGISQSDLTLTHNNVARTLTIQVGNSGTDRLLLANFDPTGSNGSLVIERLAFADGSSVDLESLLEPSGPVATEGDDVITTGAGNDFVDALGGNDVVDTGAGNDTIIGGLGNDQLTGGAGSDSMSGSAGNDFYSVDDAGDVVIEAANQGTDTVSSTISYALSANVENLILTGNNAIDGTGNSLNNILTGNSAANVLTGGAGADTLLGGAGDDTYVVDQAGDVVTEQANEGIDLVQSSVDYTLGANLENLTLTGSAVNGTGNSLNNVLTDVSGVTNVLAGGAGDDTYVVGTGDTAVEAANEGTDLVQSRVDYTLGANLEHLTLTGSAVNGTGNSLNNVLTGNSAANVLTGGAGDDTYGVGTGDTVVESINEGIDTVQSDGSWTLGENVEQLTLTGTDAINGTGNELTNVLTGNSAANVLTGGAGDDTYGVGTGDTVVESINEGIDTVQSDGSWTLGENVEHLELTGTDAIDGTGNALTNVLTGNSAANVLTGGAGVDTLLGGAGDDTYGVDQAGDVVTENANEGTDTVQSSVSWTLGTNLEHLTLTGTDAIDGIGNELNNGLTGNSAANVLTGGAGADTLTGGAGDDTYVVGAGDTVVEAANDGIDTVQSDASYTLGANVEHLVLTGTDAIDGTGNALTNVLTGNSAANVLTGGAGADTLLGGAGDDTYGVDQAGDVVTENANEGTDTVQSSVSWTLGTNLEHLTLTGTDAIDGIGNELNNGLTGNSAANVLTGGAGHDTYVVGAGDTVVEAANEGTDLVQSSVSFTLGANVEKLTLTGTDAIDGTGNSVNNTLTGNSAANVLTGGAGQDTYVVGAGDTVVEATNEGTDLVQSEVSWTLGANLERLTLTGTGAIDGTGNSLSNVLTGNSAANVLTGGAGHDTYVVGAGDTVVEAANAGSDLVQSSVSWTLGANIEYLTLTGTGAIDGTGNSLNNTLTGNSAANVLTGGAGHDTYVVGAGDTVVEAANAGSDLVQSSVSFTLGANVEKMTLIGTDAIDGTGNNLGNILTGNSAANVLSGGSGNDTLDGGVGADSMHGGSDNDTYVVDNVGDQVVEASAEGADLVQSAVSFTLGANIEYLTLTGTGAIDGTGNNLNNTLTGNSGVNVLTGGAGSDTYVVSAGDTVVEAAAEGTDLVQSAVSFTLGANVENLTLTGTGAIDGTGNSLSNILTGNSGVNVLTGGAGSDTYVVGAGDTVVEAAAEGTDLVQSAVSFTLGANVENLTLTGTGAINGTGNSLNNTLTGNSAANVLTGGAGHDTYVVGAGDTVVEAANEGTDLVQSSVSWTLGANLERLTLTGTGAIEGTGNSLNNVLTGNSAANILTGGAGNDTLAGGLGNDTYRVDRGEGQDAIAENDGTGGNSDLLLYGATINPLDLVLSRQVDHLRIAIHGSTDAVTVQNWFSAPTTAQVETIQAGNGQTLLSTQVDQLIQAMATFSQQTGLTWDAAIAGGGTPQDQVQFQGILAASWQ